MTAGRKTGGRIAGTPNKATLQGREAIKQFVDGNAHRLVGWLEKIAEENPKAAFDCFMSVCEFHLPKMSRQEITGGAHHQINVITGVDSPLSLSKELAPRLNLLKISSRLRGTPQFWLGRDISPLYLFFSISKRHYATGKSHVFAVIAFHKPSNSHT